MKTYSERKWKKILHNNNCEFVRKINGTHECWVNKKTGRKFTIIVTRNQNPTIIARQIKELKLEV